MNGTSVLTPAKEFLTQFAAKNSMVTTCNCTASKQSSSKKENSPNAIKNKMGDFQLEMKADHVFVGVRQPGAAFSCRLMTSEPHRVKQDLIEALQQHR